MGKTTIVFGPALIIVLVVPAAESVSVLAAVRLVTAGKLRRTAGWT